MALATSIDLPYDADAPLVVPVSITAPWKTIIEAGGMDAQDAALITDPSAEIDDADNRIFRRQKRNGTTMLLRMGYDDGISTVTSPVIAVFGRFDSTEVWQRLKNKDGDASVTLTVDLTNDVSDGTMNYTHPDMTTHAFDCAGCNEFIVGKETALAATGTVSTAFLQAKFI